MESPTTNQYVVTNALFSSGLLSRKAEVTDGRAKISARFFVSFFILNSFLYIAHDVEPPQRRCCTYFRMYAQSSVAFAAGGNFLV